MSRHFDLLHEQSNIVSALEKRRHNCFNSVKLPILTSQYYNISTRTDLTNRMHDDRGGRIRTHTRDITQNDVQYILLFEVVRCYIPSGFITREAITRTISLPSTSPL